MSAATVDAGEILLTHSSACGKHTQHCLVATSQCDCCGTHRDAAAFAGAELPSCFKSKQAMQQQVDWLAPSVPVLEQSVADTAIDVHPPHQHNTSCHSPYALCLLAS